jgi:ferredoxin
VNAIYAEDDVPEDQREFVELNRKLSTTYINITKAESALSDADTWADVLPKKQYLDRG